MKTQNINICGQNVLLHPYKALFWKEQKMLILADLHLGKAAHFRKAGIPIPASVHKSDYQRLSFLIKCYNPQRVIFLGDLFHSEYNEDCRLFDSWLKQYNSTEFVLVKGNHDILKEERYESLKVEDLMIMEPFIFSHKPCQTSNDYYNLCGHIHPSVSVSTGAKQSARVSCFYFGNNLGILPSFGNFTGNSKISVKFEDKVYLVIEESVLPFNNLSLSA